jgi:hypothetical protein
LNSVVNRRLAIGHSFGGDYPRRMSAYQTWARPTRNPQPATLNSSYPLRVLRALAVKNS